MTKLIDNFELGYYANADCLICKKEQAGLYLYDGKSTGICYDCFIGIYHKVNKLLIPEKK